MVWIELMYKAELSEVDQYLEAHHQYLSQYYNAGKFLFSGPTIPREGSIILAQMDRVAAVQVVKNDPFYIHGLADYRVVQFEPNRYGKSFAVLAKTKGKKYP